MTDEIVDVVKCAYCLRPLRRTVRMIKRGTRYHKGSCANASRGLTWSSERILAHMRMMTAAAKAAKPVRSAEWQRGYQAGWKAGRRARRVFSQTEAA